MFEELFSRKKQEKTTDRELPQEIDAIQKRQGKAKKAHSSSMTVATYKRTSWLVVGGILAVGLVIIGTIASGLVADFVSYSGGEPLISTPVDTSGDTSED